MVVSDVGNYVDFGYLACPIRDPHSREVQVVLSASGMARP